MALSIRLRQITEYDLFFLRQWKNDHKESFFYKEDISEEQQIKWFQEWQKKSYDYMFIIISEGIPIGCMGIRLIDGVWDIYNVILGLSEFSGNGLMTKALMEMIQFASLLYSKPITAKILKNNKAIDWYKNNNFSITYQTSDYYTVTYQGDDI